MLTLAKFVTKVTKTPDESKEKSIKHILNSVVRATRLWF